MTNSVGPQKKPTKSWLLFSNCQTFGLANCLSMLCSDITVEYYAYPWPDINQFIDRFDTFDQILIAPPQAKDYLGDDLINRDNVLCVPPLFFNGYHPDICYLQNQDGSISKGPMGDYHSLVAYAAFMQGLNEKETISLYNIDTYKGVGYLEAWEHSRNFTINMYNECGFDIGRFFIQWCRNGPFMHSFNHPKMFCIRDIAIMVLERVGMQINKTDILPHDYLVNGPIFPVYAEIARTLGAHGSYYFKLPEEYRVITLDEFILQSFELYRSNREIKPVAGFEYQLSKTLSFIEAIR